MGRFGILTGLLVSGVLALSLVGGGGFGNVFVPGVAGSGPATPSSFGPSISADTTTAAPTRDEPVAPTAEPAEAPLTWTAAEAPVAASADASSDVPEPVEPVADDSTDVSAGEFDAAAAALDFADATAASGTSSSPWDSAVKHTAPNEISPAYTSTDPETIARVQALTAQGKTCPALGSYTTSGAPSKRSAQGVAGTTSADLISFADQYNLIRYQNCLPPVTRFVYDSCMEARLFWMAESPSPDPLDAWGHIGSTRIDGVPSVGCDGNLAGGTANTGATVATKWWQSLSHRASLYRPPNSTAGVCVALAMTHGGIDEPTSFTRAAASWRSC
jgi:hypothetical protein